jgi:hypothetical protein
MKSALILTTLVLAAGLANASIVSGSVTKVSPDKARDNLFKIKTPTDTKPLSVINVNKNDTVFGFDEQQNVQFGAAPSFDKTGLTGVNANTWVSSHYVYFDPKISQNIQGTVTFSDTILGVYFTKNSLWASHDEFGLASNVTYNYANLIGLENGDRSHTSILGNVLSFNWTASSPGDHIRVITAAVPEPETYAMLLAGLGLIGTIARRRKAAQA